MNTNSTWHPFQNAVTIGQVGSENGAIVNDEEHSFGARITLERGGKTAPFAVTCGIYGAMVHTAFFDSASSAQAGYEQMKADLTAIVAMPADTQADVERFHAALSRFVDAY